LRRDLWRRLLSVTGALLAVGSGFLAVPANARVLPAAKAGTAVGSLHAVAAKPVRSVPRSDLVAYRTTLDSNAGQSGDFNGAKATFYGSTWIDPFGITLGPDKALWFTFTIPGGGGGVGRMVLGQKPTLYTLPDFHSPGRITVGTDGNMWFVEPGPGKIGRVTPSGVYTFFSYPGAVTPASITAGPDGAMWFTDFESGSIGRITPSGSVTLFYVGGYNYPLSIVSGPDGALWYTVTSGISRMTTSGQVTTFNTCASRSLTVGPDGALWYICGPSNPSVGRITTGGAITQFPQPAGLTGSTITSGPDGALWFTGDGNGFTEVGRITTTGVCTTYVKPATDPSYGWSDLLPWGIVAGPDGALWFSTEDGFARITPTGAIRTVAWGNGIDLPSWMTAGPDGAMWFVNQANGSIGRIDMHGASKSFFPTPHGVDEMSSLAADSNGNLWYLNAVWPGTIDKMSPSGQWTEYRLGYSPGPGSVISRPDGSIWFTSYYGVERMDATGKHSLIYRYPGLPEVMVNGPNGNVWLFDGNIVEIDPSGAATVLPNTNLDITELAPSPDGSLWFENGYGGIGHRLPDGSVTIFDVPGSNTPFSYALDTGLVVGPDGAAWFTTKQGVGRINAEGGVTFYTTPGNGTLWPHIYEPWSIAVGPDGAFWITAASGIVRLQPTAAPIVPHQPILSDTTAGGTAVTYEIPFTTSSQGAIPQAGQGCPANCTITVDTPPGTILPSDPATYSLSAGGTPVASVASVSVNAAPGPPDQSPSQTPNRVQISLAASNITAADTVTLTISDVTNPVNAHTVDLTVSTSSDTSPEGSPNYSISAAQLASLQIAHGNNQSVSVGQSYLPLEVNGTDRYGNAVPDVPISFTLPANDPTASFTSCPTNPSGSTCTATTDPGGNASVTVAAGHATGPMQVTASTSEGTAVTFDLNQVPGPPAALAVIAGSPQSTPVGQPFPTPLTVQVRDLYGNPVPFGGANTARASVVFMAPPGGGVPSGAFQCGGPSSPCEIWVDASGDAAAPTFVANNMAGSYTVTAAANSTNSTATFDLTNQAAPTTTSTATRSQAADSHAPEAANHRRNKPT